MHSVEHGKHRGSVGGRARAGVLRVVELKHRVINRAITKFVVCQILMSDDHRAYMRRDEFETDAQ